MDITPSATYIQLRLSRNRLIISLAKAFAALLVLSATCYGLLVVSSPSEIWPRRVVRDNQLKAPISVLDIQGDMLLTDEGTFRLAGVHWPTDVHDQARTKSFLRIATAQGIEITRSVTPTSKMIRCEPRIYHRCGNDPIAAHFEQYCLNELIVALGHATLDTQPIGLSEIELTRLKAASTIAKERRSNRGLDSPIASEQKLTDRGLNISDLMGLNTMIKWQALSEHGL